MDTGIMRAGASRDAVTGREASASERIVAALRSDILSGDLRPRARLNQRDLAKRFGVSRIPVRDALRTLASEGLVVATDQQGVAVAPLTTADLQELYELRLAIEPLITRLALPNFGRGEIARMQHWMEVMDQTDDEAEWLEANDRFHSVIYAKADRPRMIELCRQLRQHTGRYVRVFLSVLHGREQLSRDHAMILDAASRGDGVALESLVKAHLSSTYDPLFRYLAQEELRAEGAAARGNPAARST